MRVARCFACGSRPPLPMEPRRIRYPLACNAKRPCCLPTRGRPCSDTLVRLVRDVIRIALVASALASLAAAPAEARAPAPRIAVLSNRADLVSGGDALVRVTLPRGVKAGRLRLTAGRRDVTGALQRAGTGRREGVLTGLPVGRVKLTARIRRGSAARLFVTNHPIGGPIFAGPQIQPRTCAEGATAAQCY